MSRGALINKQLASLFKGVECRLPCRLMLNGFSKGLSAAVYR